MTKRTLSLLLAVLLLLTALPFATLAEDELPPEELPAVEEIQSEPTAVAKATVAPDTASEPEFMDQSDLQDVDSMSASSGKCGKNLTWSLNTSTNTLTITGTGAMYDYTWPNAPWVGLESITVSLPEGLTHIGNFAFVECFDMKVNIPSTVKSIGNGAFFCCGVGAITLPEGLTTIGESAFLNCWNLETTIPDSVTTIGDAAFCGCFNLGNKGYIVIRNVLYGFGNGFADIAQEEGAVVIPDGVTDVSGGAFDDCEISTVTIPVSVRNIGVGAFLCADGPTDVYYKGTKEQRKQLLTIDNRNEELLEATWHYETTPTPTATGTCGDNLTWAFYGHTGTLVIEGSGEMNYYDPWGPYEEKIKSVSLPEGLTGIGWEVFRGCTSLTSIIIPDSVTKIESSAFSDCTGLTSITIGSGVSSIGWNVFSGCSSLTEIQAAEGNCNYCSMDGVLFSKDKKTLIAYPGGKQGGYTIPDCVTAIGSFAFCVCPGLTSIIIPDSVLSIDEYAFSSCTRLTRVTIGNSVTSIGEHAFSYCPKLISVTIGNNVTSIGWAAFYNCTGLTSITIPASVTSIVENAFSGCSRLASIQVAEGNSNYCSVNGVLFSKDIKTLIKCPDGKQGSYTIPDSVTSIGGGAFSGCTSLTSITIPGSVTSIGGGMFSGCTSLTSITIENGVTSIGWAAFSGCDRLITVILPESITYIELSAFNYCDNLKHIYYAGTETQREMITIGDDNEELLDATWHYETTVVPTPVAPEGAPVIVTQPKGVAVNNGKTAKFSVKATGAKTYQWQVSMDGGLSWEDVPKATKKTLSVKTVKSMAEWEYAYRCLVSNGVGTAYTDSAYLTVNLVPPTISTQPKNAVVKLGKNAAFSLKAKGAKKYQWQVDDGSGWEDVPKATKSKLTLKKVTYSMDGNAYRCLVSNNDGSVYTYEAVLTVDISGTYVGWTGIVYNCKSWVNIRSGPGTKYAQVGTAWKNEEYIIKDIYGSWYMVEYDDGVAWIAKKYIKPSPIGRTGTVYNCKSWVNVRKGPGTKYAKLGTVSKGETFTILDMSGSWYLADYYGLNIWIFNKYVKVS